MTRGQLMVGLALVIGACGWTAVLTRTARSVTSSTTASMGILQKPSLEQGPFAAFFENQTRPGPSPMMSSESGRSASGSMPTGIRLDSTFLSQHRQAAVINDQWCYPGEQIHTTEGDFTLLKVETDRVILKGQGQTWSVRLAWQAGHTDRRS